MDHAGLLVRWLVFLLAAASLLIIFFATTTSTRFHLDETRQRQVGVTPATTVSKFHHHFIAGLFHSNPGHIAFNLGLFTLGYWLATRHTSPHVVVLAAYGIGILTVFLLHLLVVLPLAAIQLPYAVNALDRPLVGFSVIAYATLGMGLIGLPQAWQLGAFATILVFETIAGIGFTGPFISVYHLGGLAAGFGLRWLALRQAVGAN